MVVSCNLPSAFSLLGMIMRAWAATKEALVEENIHLREEDEKIFLSQVSRLEDSETLLMFGYIASAARKGDRDGIMQAKIVETLVPEPDQKERHRVRQDIARRGGTLSFFQLVSREELTPTAVEFSLTEDGKRCVAIFEEKFHIELNGGERCIAAEC